MYTCTRMNKRISVFCLPPFRSFYVRVFVLCTNMCVHVQGPAVRAIIPGTVALCLKDNRGNSIKWPWMVHSCRSTLFLTRLTDQSGARARATHGISPAACVPPAARLVLQTKQRRQSQLPPVHAVRIDLLFLPAVPSRCPGIEPIECYSIRIVSSPRVSYLGRRLLRRRRQPRATDYRLLLDRNIARGTTFEQHLFMIRSLIGFRVTGWDLFWLGY